MKYHMESVSYPELRAEYDAYVESNGKKIEELSVSSDDDESVVTCVNIINTCMDSLREEDPIWNKIRDMTKRYAHVDHILWLSLKGIAKCPPGQYDKLSKLRDEISLSMDRLKDDHIECIHRKVILYRIVVSCYNIVIEFRSLEEMKKQLQNRKEQLRDDMKHLGEGDTELTKMLSNLCDAT